MSRDLIPPGAVVWDVLTLASLLFPTLQMALIPENSCWRSSLFKDVQYFWSLSLHRCDHMMISHILPVNSAFFFLIISFEKLTEPLDIVWSWDIVCCCSSGLYWGIVSCSKTLNNYYDTKFRIKQMSHKEGREANMEMRTGACAVNQWLWSCYCKINVDFVYSPQHRSIPVKKTAPDWPQNGISWLHPAAPAVFCFHVEYPNLSGLCCTFLIPAVSM